MLQNASATVIAADASGAPPRWVELLPAGEFTMIDGRGPYRLVDADAVARASLQEAPGHSLPVDYDHAIDYAAPNGGAAPAAGWIASLEARGGGIWGLVGWTSRAAAAIKALEYRHLSPVFQHRPDGSIVRILRAALTNNPAMRLVALASATRASAAPVAAALDCEAIARRAQIRQEQARAGGSPISVAEAIRAEIAAGAASPGGAINPTEAAFKARQVVSELGALGIRIELGQAVLQVIGGRK